MTAGRSDCPPADVRCSGRGPSSDTQAALHHVQDDADRAWDAPSFSGTGMLGYDTLRALDPDGFQTATCVESLDTDTQATTGGTGRPPSRPTRTVLQRETRIVTDRSARSAPHHGSRGPGQVHEGDRPS